MPSTPGGDVAVNGQSQTQSHFVAVALEVHMALLCPCAPEG
jgi:hypothetical protein